MENTTCNQPEANTNTFENVLKIAAYPLAVVTGYGVADNVVRKNMYKNFAQHGIFNDLQKERTEKFKELLKGVPKGEAIDAADQVQKLEQEFRAKIKGRFEQMGMHGMSDYWKTLKQNQKIDALVMGTTVAGIAIGAMLTVAHEKNWVESLTTARKNNETAPENTPSL